MDDKELEHLGDFQEAYREEFNEELTEGEARVMLSQLVQFYRLIMRPLPPDDQDEKE
jgi:hypothetical protein